MEDVWIKRAAVSREGGRLPVKNLQKSSIKQSSCFRPNNLSLIQTPSEEAFYLVALSLLSEGAFYYYHHYNVVYSGKTIKSIKSMTII